MEVGSLPEEADFVVCDGISFQVSHDALLAFLMHNGEIQNDEEDQPETEQIVNEITLQNQKEQQRRKDALMMAFGGSVYFEEDAETEKQLLLSGDDSAIEEEVEDDYDEFQDDEVDESQDTNPRHDMIRQHSSLEASNPEQSDNANSQPSPAQTPISSAGSSVSSESDVGSARTSNSQKSKIQDSSQSQITGNIYSQDLNSTFNSRTLPHNVSQSPYQMNKFQMGKLQTYSVEQLLPSKFNAHNNIIESSPANSQLSIENIQESHRKHTTQEQSNNNPQFTRSPRNVGKLDTRRTKKKREFSFVVSSGVATIPIQEQDTRSQIHHLSQKSLQTNFSLHLPHSSLTSIVDSKPSGSFSIQQSPRINKANNQLQSSSVDIQNGSDYLGHQNQPMVVSPVHAMNKWQSGSVLISQQQDNNVWMQQYDGQQQQQQQQQVNNIKSPKKLSLPIISSQIDQISSETNHDTSEGQKIPSYQTPIITRTPIHLDQQMNQMNQSPPDYDVRNSEQMTPPFQQYINSHLYSQESLLSPKEQSMNGDQGIQSFHQLTQITEQDNKVIIPDYIINMRANMLSLRSYKIQQRRKILEQMKDSQMNKEQKQQQQQQQQYINHIQIADNEYNDSISFSNNFEVGQFFLSLLNGEQFIINSELKQDKQTQDIKYKLQEDIPRHQLFYVQLYKDWFNCLNITKIIRMNKNEINYRSGNNTRYISQLYYDKVLIPNSQYSSDIDIVRGEQNIFLLNLVPASFLSHKLTAMTYPSFLSNFEQTTMHFMQQKVQQKYADNHEEVQQWIDRRNKFNRDIVSITQKKRIYRRISKANKSQKLSDKSKKLINELHKSQSTLFMVQSIKDDTKERVLKRTMHNRRRLKRQSLLYQLELIANQIGFKSTARSNSYTGPNILVKQSASLGFGPVKSKQQTLKDNLIEKQNSLTSFRSKSQMKEKRPIKSIQFQQQKKGESFDKIEQKNNFQANNQIQDVNESVLVNPQLNTNAIFGPKEIITKEKPQLSEKQEKKEKQKTNQQYINKKKEIKQLENEINQKHNDPDQRSNSTLNTDQTNSKTSLSTNLVSNINCSSSSQSQFVTSQLAQQNDIQQTIIDKNRDVNKGVNSSFTDQREKQQQKRRESFAKYQNQQLMNLKDKEQEQEQENDINQDSTLKRKQKKNRSSIIKQKRISTISNKAEQDRQSYSDDESYSSSSSYNLSANSYNSIFSSTSVSSSVSYTSNSHNSVHSNNSQNSENQQKQQKQRKNSRIQKQETNKSKIRRKSRVDSKLSSEDEDYGFQKTDMKKKRISKQENEKLNKNQKKKENKERKKNRSSVVADILETDNFKGNIKPESQVVEDLQVQQQNRYQNDLDQKYIFEQQQNIQERSNQHTPIKSNNNVSNTNSKSDPSVNRYQPQQIASAQKNLQQYINYVQTKKGTVKVNEDALNIFSPLHWEKITEKKMRKTESFDQSYVSTNSCHTSGRYDTSNDSLNFFNSEQQHQIAQHGINLSALSSSLTSLPLPIRNNNNYTNVQHNQQQFFYTTPTPNNLISSKTSTGFTPIINSQQSQRDQVSHSLQNIGNNNNKRQLSQQQYSGRGKMKGSQTDRKTEREKETEKEIDLFLQNQALIQQQNPFSIQSHQNMLNNSGIFSERSNLKVKQQIRPHPLPPLKGLTYQQRLSPSPPTIQNNIQQPKNQHQNQQQQQQQQYSALNQTNTSISSQFLHNQDNISYSSFTTQSFSLSGTQSDFNSPEQQNQSSLKHLQQQQCLSEQILHSQLQQISSQQKEMDNNNANSSSPPERVQLPQIKERRSSISAKGNRTNKIQENKKTLNKDINGNEQNVIQQPIYTSTNKNVNADKLRQDIGADLSNMRKKMQDNYQTSPQQIQIQQQQNQQPIIDSQITPIQLRLTGHSPVFQHANMLKQGGTTPDINDDKRNVIINEILNQSQSVEQKVKDKEKQQQQQKNQFHFTQSNKPSLFKQLQTQQNIKQEIQQEIQLHNQIDEKRDENDPNQNSEHPHKHHLHTIHKRRKDSKTYLQQEQQIKHHHHQHHKHHHHHHPKDVESVSLMKSKLSKEQLSKLRQSRLQLKELKKSVKMNYQPVFKSKFKQLHLPFVSNIHISSPEPLIGANTNDLTFMFNNAPLPSVKEIEALCKQRGVEVEIEDEYEWILPCSFSIPGLDVNKSLKYMRRFGETLKFDAFDFAVLTAKHPLCVFAFWLLSKIGIVKELGVERGTLQEFLIVADSLYNTCLVQYHTSIHATDVLQLFHILLHVNDNVYHLANNAALQSVQFNQVNSQYNSPLESNMLSSSSFIDKENEKEKEKENNTKKRKTVLAQLKKRKDEAVRQAYQQGEITKNYPPIEIFAMYIAAICHDLSHPGVSNAFLSASEHPVAQHFNYKSPLESFHAQTALNIIRMMPGCDITKSFAEIPAKMQVFRRILIEAILSTDAGVSHFTTNRELNAKVVTIIEPVSSQDHTPSKQMSLLQQANNLHSKFSFSSPNLTPMSVISQTQSFTNQQQQADPFSSSTESLMGNNSNNNSNNNTNQSQGLKISQKMMQQMKRKNALIIMKPKVYGTSTSSPTTPVFGHHEYFDEFESEQGNEILQQDKETELQMNLQQVIDDTNKDGNESDQIKENNKKRKRIGIEIEITKAEEEKSKEKTVFEQNPQSISKQQRKLAKPSQLSQGISDSQEIDDKENEGDKQEKKTDISDNNKLNNTSTNYKSDLKQPQRRISTFSNKIPSQLTYIRPRADSLADQLHSLKLNNQLISPQNNQLISPQNNQLISPQNNQLISPQNSNKEQTQEQTSNSQTASRNSPSPSSIVSPSRRSSLAAPKMPRRSLIVNVISPSYQSMLKKHDFSDVDQVDKHSQSQSQLTPYSPSQHQSMASLQQLIEENKQQEPVMKQVSNLDLAKNPADRLLLCQGILGCADMGSQCRQFKIAKKATLAVSREFFQQGDLERMGKMAVSKFMDRTTANDKEIANSQIGFIDFLLGPLIDAVSPHINADLRVKTELNHNRSAWRRIALGCEPDDEEDISDVEGSNEVFNPIRDGDADKSKYQFLGERFDELMSADLGEILNAIDVAFGKQEGKSE